MSAFAKHIPPKKLIEIILHSLPYSPNELMNSHDVLLRKIFRGKNFQNMDIYIVFLSTNKYKKIRVHFNAVFLFLYGMLKPLLPLAQLIYLWFGIANICFQKPLVSDHTRTRITNSYLLRHQLLRAGEVIRRLLLAPKNSYFYATP